MITRRAATLLTMLALVAGAGGPAHGQAIAMPTPTFQYETPALPAGAFYNSNEGPLVVDLNFDGSNDIVIAGDDGIVPRLYTYARTGPALSASSIVFYDGALTPVAADVADYHQLSVADGVSLHQIVWYAGDTTAKPLPGWPKNDTANESAMFADLTTDPAKDLVSMTPVGQSGGPIHVRQRSGAETAPWPVDTIATSLFNPVTGETSEQLGGGRRASVAVGDVDGDNQPNVVLGGISNGHDGLMTLKNNATDPRIKLESSVDISYDGPPVTIVSGTDRRIAIGFDDFDAIGGVALHELTSTSITRTLRRFDQIDTLPEVPPIAGRLDPAQGPAVVAVDDGFTDDADFSLINPANQIHAFPLNSSGELPGFPVPLPNGGFIKGAPVIGDIDGDGDFEIVANSSEGVLAWHHNGEAYRIVNGQITAITTLTVTDGNDTYKVQTITNPIAGAANTAVWFDPIEVESDNDFVYIFPGSTALPPTADEFDDFLFDHDPVQTFTGVYRGWSASVPGNSIKIVLRTNEEGNFLGYKVKKVLAGTSQDFASSVGADLGNPSNVGITSGSPWLGDLNRDGLLDLAFVLTPFSGQPRVRVVNLNTPYRPERLEWPMYRHDPARTNAYTVPVAAPASSPPQLRPIGNRTIAEGQLLQFALNGVDPDPQTLTFLVTTALPPGATFNPPTFSYTPPVGTVSGASSSVTIPMTFAVSDGSATDSESITLTVLKQPTITVTSPAGPPREVWVNGSVHPITWTTVGGTPTPFTIRLSNGTTIASNVAQSPFNWSVPAGLAAGEYVVTVCSTFGGATEICGASTTFAVTVGNYLDLFVTTAPTLATGSLVAGGTATFYADIKNNAGTAVGPFNDRFDIDLNSASFATADVTLSPTPTLGNVQAQETRRVNSGVWANLPPGTHAVRVCADQPTPVVTELSEANNCAVSTVVVTAPAGIDLVVTAPPSLASGVLSSGNTVTLQATIKNQGGAAIAAPFPSRFSIDLNNPVFQTADVTLSPDASTASLAAGATAQVTSANWSTIPAGRHTIRFCTDAPTSAVAETNETNNCADATVIVEPYFGFTVTAGNLTLAAGTYAATDVTFTRVGTGAPSAATVSVTGLPAGATTVVGAGGCTPTCTTKLVINSLATTPVGTYPISIVGTAGSVTASTPVTLTVTAPPDQRPFKQASSSPYLVSMEAEHFTQNRAFLFGGNPPYPTLEVVAWTPDTYPGASGNAAMLLTPPRGVSFLTSTVSRLDFKVDFLKTNTHYIWLRGRNAQGAYNKYLAAGLDGTLIDTADNITFAAVDTSWIWNEKFYSGIRIKFSPPSVGVHTISIYMQTDGVGLDKVVLTNSGSYVPTGVGPSESPR